MGIHHIYFDPMKLRSETVGEKIERNARINMEFLVVHTAIFLGMKKKFM